MTAAGSFQATVDVVVVDRTLVNPGGRLRTLSR